MYMQRTILTFEFLGYEGFDLGMNVGLLVELFAETMSLPSMYLAVSSFLRKHT